MTWWRGGGRGAAGLGEGPDVAWVVAADWQELDRGGNGQAARACVRQHETGEMGTPTGGPRATVKGSVVKTV
jgi:hypothetical protein